MKMNFSKDELEQVPLMPSSVKWTMFVKPCRAANSSNIAF